MSTLSLGNPFPIVLATLRRHRFLSLLFVILVGVAVGLGVAITAQERALRQGSARAADRFDLVVGAPGSQTDLLLTTVYLRPKAVELLAPEVVRKLLQEPRAGFAAPIAFGDNFRGLPIVGTVAGFVTHLSGGLAEGRLFAAEGEAVVGAAVNLAIGATFRPTHGREAETDAAEADEHAEGHEHHTDVTVVGRMKPTGTPWDRAIVVPVEMVWEVHDLPNGHAEGEERIGPPFDPGRTPGVPAFVVKPESVPAAYGLRNQYRTSASTAFFPAEALIEFYAVMGDVRRLMNVMSLGAEALVVAAVAAGLAALVELHRRRFALLRVLGASRAYVFLSVWTLVVLLVGAGALLGLGLGYAFAAAISAWLQAETGIALSAAIGAGELTLALGLVVVGSMIALVPAWLAYRRPALAALRD